MKVLVGGVIALAAIAYVIKKLLNRRCEPAVSDLGAGLDAPNRKLARGWNMRGRRSFTRDDIEKLRRLIRRKETADRPAQKILRSKMRQTGFYITDFERDHSGFTTSDLDHLVSSGSIEIQE